jgi:hypothetical protein
MNADAVSDLMLALVCGLVFARRIRDLPGLAIPALLVGFAACIGVLRFSGVGFALGPHRCASLFAACAAFPLLAYSLRYPGDPVARHFAAASRFAFLLGGLGVAATVVGAAKWGDAAAGLSALVILWTMLLAGDFLRLVGAIALIAGFVVVLTIPPEARYFGFFTQIQGLHYLLCIAFAALTARAGTRQSAVNDGLAGKAEAGR